MQQNQHQANQEPLLEFKTKNSSFNERNTKKGLSKERILIIVLSIVIVALIGVIGFLLFSSNSSSNTNENGQDSMPITLPAKIKQQTTKKSKVTKPTTSADPYPDYGIDGEFKQKVDEDTEKALIADTTQVPNDDETSDVTEETLEEIGENESNEDEKEPVNTQSNEDLMNSLNGSWDLIESKNFDKLMDKLGVSWIKKQMASKLKPTVIISKKLNDEYSLITKSSVKTTEIIFKLGVPFKETTLDDKDVMTTMTIEDDRLVQRQMNGDKEHCVITRLLNAKGEMITYAQAGDVISERTYVRKP